MPGILFLMPLDAVDDVLKTALRPESQVAESENWRAYRLLTEGVPVDFRASDGSIRAVAGTADWLLGYHPGLPELPCTKETPCLKCRFMAHARRARSLFAMCVPADEALAIREDVAFIEAVRASIAKIEARTARAPTSRPKST